MWTFAQPEVREAQVFTQMPSAFRRTGVRSDWADANRGGQDTDSFLEGPVFDAAGNLFVTDIPFGRIFRIDSAGSWALVAEYGGEPNGMKFLNERELLIADYRNGLMVCDIASGVVRPFLERRNSERFKGVNDLIFASNGDMYFTDQGQTGQHDRTGRLYRLRAGGELECILDCIPSPNGLVLNKAETVVFLCVTRDNAIWRVPLLPDGSATKVGVFIQMSGGVGPDGMAIDQEENLIVCHIGLGSLWVFSPIGEPLYRIKSCAGLATTNCAFGGPERKTLFITESRTGTVLKAELPVPGRLMYSHM